MLLLLLPSGLGAASSGHAAPALPGSSGTLASPATGARALAFPTPLQHVIVVTLENEEATSALTQPFEAHLAYTYAYASNYYAISHPSAPNYLTMTAASVFNQTGSDNYNVYSSVNLANLIQAVGGSWGAYDENMPQPCDINDSGSYAVKHNPMTYYRNIVDHRATECNLYDLPQSAWNSSVASDTLPNYVFYTPNLENDGHNTNVATADAWLKGWLSPLLNDSFYQSSAFLITYDEGSTLNGYNGTYGGNVYFVAVSPYAHMHYTATKDYSHYDLVTTIEWLFGLGTCGHNDNPATFPPMKDLFVFPTSSGGPAHYVVHGTVRATGGGPLTGATVTTNLGNSTTTASNGTYRFALPNGSYTITASATGYAPLTQGETVNGAGGDLDFNLTVTSGATYPLQGLLTGSFPSLTPLPGATIFLNATVGQLTTTSSGSGAYSVAATNGTWSVTATAPGFHPASTSVTVRGQGAWANLTLRPFPATVTLVPASPSVVTGADSHLTVLVVDPDGSPASGAVVTLASSPLALPFSTGTSVTLPSNGTGVVAFVAPTVVSSTGVTISATVASASSFPGWGNASVTIVPQGAAQTGGLAGTVEDSTSHAAIVGATVSVLLQGSTTTVMVLSSDAQGAFSASGLQPATYTLEASATGYLGAETNVTVSAGASSGPVTIDLTRIPTPGGGGPGPSPFSLAALLADPLFLLLLAAVVAGTIVGLLLLRRRRGRAPPPAWDGSATGPPGWAGDPYASAGWPPSS